MGKRLTAKESAFCERIAAGDNVAVAYKTAYDTELDGQLLFSNGHNVYKRPQVQERLKEIEREKVEKTADSIIDERNKQIAFINSRIEHCKKKEDEQSIIRYTDMLNRIHGLYKGDNADLTQENSLNGVSADVLQKIAESI